MSSARRYILVNRGKIPSNNLHLNFCYNSFYLQFFLQLDAMNIFGLFRKLYNFERRKPPNDGKETAQNNGSLILSF